MPQVINEILQKNLTSISLEKPNRDSHVSRYKRNTMDTNAGIRQGPNKQMSSYTRIVKPKTGKAGRDQGQKHQ